MILVPYSICKESGPAWQVVPPTQEKKQSQIDEGKPRWRWSAFLKGLRDGHYLGWQNKDQDWIWIYNLETGKGAAVTVDWDFSRFSSLQYTGGKHAIHRHGPCGLFLRKTRHDWHWHHVPSAVESNPMIIIASKPGDFGTFATFTFTTLATRTFSVNSPISNYASRRIAANIVQPKFLSHYSGQDKILPCYLVISPV